MADLSLLNPRGFATRIALIRVMYGFVHQLSARCERCNRSYLNDLAADFIADEPDHPVCRIWCTACRNTPVIVNIVVLDGVIRNFFPLMRREAVMTELCELEHPFPAPHELKRHFGEAFDLSLLFHFGSYRNAMRARGVPDYDDPLVRKHWEDTVRPFLGTIPDSMIAHVVGVQVTEIVALRQNYGIPAHS